MADDITLSTLSGTPVAATDQIGAGHHYQRVKITNGTADDDTNHWQVDSSGRGLVYSTVAGGAVASGATDSGNPVKTGGKYNSTPPTFTDGQRGDTQLDTRGNAKVTLVAQDGTNSALGDAVANPTVSLVGAPLLVWDQNTSLWKRLRGDPSGVYVQGGYAPGGTQFAPPVPVGGVDGGGLARHILTDTGGRASTVGANLTAVTGSWTSATAGNTAVTVPCGGMTTVVFSLVQGTTLTGGVVTFEGDDGSGTWFPLYPVRQTVAPALVETTYTLTASTNVLWTANTAGFTNVRVRLSTVITGTGTVAVRGVASSAQYDSAVSIENVPAVTQSAGPWSQNVTQFGGNALATGTGAGGTGVPRVTVSNDSTVGQAGTWTVQPGNTANTTAWLVSTRPGTSGGLSVATGSIAATKTDIKTSAGQVYGWYLYNQHSAASYVQFFNATAANVTLGTTAPVYSLAIPATSGANVLHETGIAHGTAISIAVTTTRTGSTGPAANIDYNIFYA